MPFEAPERRAGRFGGGFGQNSQAFQAYTSCLKDHGVTVPSGPSGASGARRTPGDFRNLQSDPKFAAANKTCQVLLPARNGTLRRRRSGTDMSRRVMLNVALVVVLVLIGGATFAAVRSSSGSSATTQTLATAKRGTVLESVTSTGNVEAPTSLSLSFQQSGEVTAIYVKSGQHVVKNQALAQVDDTQQSQSLAVGQGVAGIRAGLAHGVAAR